MEKFVATPELFSESSIGSDPLPPGQAEPIIDAMAIPCVKSRHPSRKYVSEQVVYEEVREKFNRFLSLSNEWRSSI